MRVVDGGDQLPDVGLHLDRAPGRTVEQIADLVLVRLGGPEAGHRELGAEPRALEEAAADVEDRAVAAVGLELGYRVPHHARYAARTVSEPELEVLAALAAATHLDLPHEQWL